jgi:ABC-type lipoprotein export system ATPase subunit
VSHAYFFFLLLSGVDRQDVQVPKELKRALRHALKEKAPDPPGHSTFQERLLSEREEILEKYAEDVLVQQSYELMEKLKTKHPDRTVRVKDGSFKVTDYFDADEEEGKKKKQKMATVYNSGPTYMILDRIKRMIRSGRPCPKLMSHERVCMKGVNLFLEPGKTYLVLGAPRSGKSTLLRMIAGILQEDPDHQVGGKVSLNTFHSKSEDVVWSNYVGYIDQIDRLHPYLTVKETCEFAWRCRSGGTHRTPMNGEGPEVDAEIKRMDDNLHVIKVLLEGTGLKRVSDTFVGDQQTVRGVSGGEKKRVTLAEMGVGTFPVLCADEISTGLDGKWGQYYHGDSVSEIIKLILTSLFG